MSSSLLTAFRQRYPKGSLVSDLMTIHDGLYLVRVTVVVDGLILSTALAAQTTLEIAEDAACERALARLGLPKQEAIPGIHQPESPSTDLPLQPTASATPALQPVPVNNGFDPNHQEQQEPLLSLLTTPDEPSPLPSPATISLVPPPTKLRPVDAQPVKPLPIEPLAVDPQPVKPLPVNPLPLEAPIIEPPHPLFPDDNSPSLENDLLDLEGIPTPSIDLSDIIAQTDVELQRLGWSVSQGREFLKKTYGKLSRHDLTDEELLEFLLFLETQPTP